MRYNPMFDIILDSGEEMPVFRSISVNFLTNFIIISKSWPDQGGHKNGKNCSPGPNICVKPYK